jgi:hypothetical protein
MPFDKDQKRDLQEILEKAIRAGGRSDGGSQSRDTSVGSGNDAKQIDDFNAGLKELAENAMRVYEKIDEARGSFSAFTGLANEGVPVLRKFSSAVRGLGIDYRESAEAFKSLTEGIPNFLNLKEEMQTTMAVQSAMLNKLGLDYSTNAKNITLMTKTLGFNNTEALKLNASMFKLAQGLKQPPSVIMKDFAAAMPKLIQFGKDSMRIFAQTEAVATKLKISTEQLITQFSQFDTFEEAADSAGKLNTVLKGGFFSTEDLLISDPIERLQLFVDRFEKMKETTGKGFTDLSAREQMLVAKSANIDLETFRKITTMSEEDRKALKEGQLSIEAKGDAITGIKQAAAAATTVTERMGAKKDQIDALGLKYIDLNKALEANVNKIELMAKTLDAVAQKNEGVRSMVSSIMTQAAADSVMTENRLAQTANSIQNIFTDMPGPIGEAFRKVGGAFGQGFESLLLYTEDGAKQLLNFQINGQKLGDIIGFSEQDSQKIQDSFTTYRSVVQGVRRGQLELLALPEENIQAALESERKLRAAPGQIFIEGAQALEIGYEDFVKKTTADFAKIRERYKGRETQRALLTEVMEAETAGFGAGFDSTIERIKQSYQKLAPDTIQYVKSLINASKIELNAFFDLLPTNWAKQLEDLKTILEEKAKKIGPLAGTVAAGVTSVLNAGSVPATLAPVAAPVVAGAVDPLTGMAIAGATALGAPAFTNSVQAASQNANGVVNINRQLALTNTQAMTGDLATSINDLGRALDAIEPKLSKIKIDPKQTTAVKAMADAIKEYADAVEKTQRLQNEQQKIIDVMGKMASAFAAGNINVSLDAAKIGDIVGQHVGKAVKEVAKGG